MEKAEITPGFFRLVVSLPVSFGDELLSKLRRERVIA
jgi:hypothetical protein